MGTTCPMVDGTESAWQDIKAKVDAALEILAKSPISLNTDHASYVIGDADIMAFILLSLYEPTALFPVTFALLASLLRHDRTTMSAIMGALIPTPSIQTVCTGCTGPDCVQPPVSEDAQAAIVCSDGESSVDLTLSDWTAYFQELANQSAVSTSWSEIRFRCANWPARPPYRFTGPFATPPHDPSLTEGRPAAPLLFLSSRIDPVTPVRNAHAMAARHPGSAVVTQESVGHCALGTAISSCTVGIVRAYFENGTVPERGAVCDLDCGDFEACVKDRQQTAPIPWFGKGPVSHLGGVDAGVMQDMSMSFIQQWF